MPPSRVRRLEGEDRLLAWLRRLADREAPLLGDDAALLALRGEVALTVDAQIAGVHVPAGLDPALVARRLLAVNLSDLAACGADPAYALLALAAPPGFDHRRFLRAFVAACRGAGVRLAGGDLARAPALQATATLLGRRRRGGRFLRRRDARPGDGLWVGGTLGESAAGCRLVRRGATLAAGRVVLPRAFARSSELAAAARRAVRRHLAPRPQLALSAWLARQDTGGVLDVSDGLARDLHRLCRESGVGATVEAAALPLPPRLPRLAARLGTTALDLALGGGEDYVLLFTLRPEREPPARFGCARIGAITRRGIRLRSDGSTRSLPPYGWDHVE